MLRLNFRIVSVYGILSFHFLNLLKFSLLVNNLLIRLFLNRSLESLSNLIEITFQFVLGTVTDWFKLSFNCKWSLLLWWCVQLLVNLLFFELLVYRFVLHNKLVLSLIQMNLNDLRFLFLLIGLRRLLWNVWKVFSNYLLVALLDAFIFCKIYYLSIRLNNAAISHSLVLFILLKLISFLRLKLKWLSNFFLNVHFASSLTCKLLQATTDIILELLSCFIQDSSKVVNWSVDLFEVVIGFFHDSWVI